MLRFRNHPDRVFMAVLTESMEMMIIRIREILAVHRKAETDGEGLLSLMPNASRVFAPEIALKTLKHVLHCHRGPGLYRLNDYHWLLLYDVLEYFCRVHNESVSTAPNDFEKERMSKTGGFHIEEIRCDGLIDIYFYNTDFLADEEAAADDPKEGVASDLHDEAFSISQGLAPHPDELKLKEIRQEVPELDIESRFWRTGSRVYPDL